MPNLYNLTADLGDLVGGDAIAATARGRVQTNLKGEALIDTGTGGQIRLGEWPVTINPDGTLLVEGLVGSDSTDLNIEPGTLQYQLVIEYRDPALQGRAADRVYRSGWFFLNATTDVGTVAKTVTPAVAQSGADIIAAASLEADRAEAAAELATAPTDTQVATLAQDPASETSAALSAAFVAGANLPASNGTDDTAALQAVLDANAGGFIVGKRGETYLLTAPLSVASGTTLDMTGCIIRRASGEGNLLRNAAALGTGARDTNVSIIGGRWDKNATTSTDPHGRHWILLHRIDGLDLRDCEFVDAGTGSKYAVLVADVTRWKVEGLHFDNLPSDGLHIQGPATQGHVRRLTGRTGDDHFAVTARDYEDYEATPGGGDVTDLVVEGLYLDGSKAGPKLLAGAGVTVQRVTIRDVYGWTDTTYGVTLRDDNVNASTTGGWIDDVSLENIAIDTPSTYSSIFIAVGGTAGNGVGAVKIRNVAVTAVDATAIRVEGNVKSLVIDGLNAPNAHNFRLVEIKAGVVADHVSLRGFKVRGVSGCYLLHTNGTIDRLNVEDGHMESGTAMLVVNGTIGTIGAAKVDLTGTAGVLVAGASAVADVTASDVACTTAFVQITGATATGILRGEIRGTPMYRSASQTARIVSLGIRHDAAKLTKTVAGDMVYNTNAGHAAGVGPLVTDGTNWKNLLTGATG